MLIYLFIWLLNLLLILFSFSLSESLSDKLFLIICFLPIILDDIFPKNRQFLFNTYNLYIYIYHLHQYIIYINFEIYIKQHHQLFLQSKSRRWPAAREIATHTTQGRARFITRPPRCRRGAAPVHVRRDARQWGGVGSAPVCVCVGPLGRASFALLGNGPSIRRGGSRDPVTCRNRPHGPGEFSVAGQRALRPTRVVT